MAKESNPLKGIVNIPRFGLFVITAGITAAGSLGLPETSILSLLPANILNVIDASGNVVASEKMHILLRFKNREKKRS